MNKIQNLRDNSDGTCNCKPLGNGCFFTNSIGGKCDCKCHKMTKTEQFKEEVNNFIQMGELTACGHCEPEKFGEGLRQAEKAIPDYKCECKCHKDKTEQIKEELRMLVLSNPPSSQVFDDFIEQKLEEQKQEAYDEGWEDRGEKIIEEVEKLKSPEATVIGKVYNQALDTVLSKLKK